MVLACLTFTQQIISPNNVAVYGGLCALASFDRQELQKKVLSSRYNVVLTDLCFVPTSVTILVRKTYSITYYKVQDLRKGWDFNCVTNHFFNDKEEQHASLCFSLSSNFRVTALSVFLWEWVSILQICFFSEGLCVCSQVKNWRQWFCWCIFSSFKLFLELEPQLRDVLYKFHESQYAACLKLLDEMKVHLN